MIISRPSSSALALEVGQLGRALLVLVALLLKNVLLLPELYQNGLSVLLKTGLLLLQVQYLLFLVAHLLVEGVPGRVQIRYLVGHVSDLILKLLLANNLLVEGLLKFLLLLFEEFLLALLLIV